MENENESSPQDDEEGSQSLPPYSSSLYPSVSTTITTLSETTTMVSTSQATTSSSDVDAKKKKHTSQRKIYRVTRRQQQQQPSLSTTDEVSEKYGNETLRQISSSSSSTKTRTASTRRSKLSIIKTKGSSGALDSQQLYLEAQRQAVEEVIGERNGDEMQNAVKGYEDELLEKKKIAAAGGDMSSFRVAQQPMLTATSLSTTNSTSSAVTSSSRLRRRIHREQSKSLSSCNNDLRDAKMVAKDGSRASNLSSSSRRSKQEGVGLTTKQQQQNGKWESVTTTTSRIVHADEDDFSDDETSIPEAPPLTRPGAIRVQPTSVSPTPPLPLDRLERGLAIHNNDDDEFHADIALSSERPRLRQRPRATHHQTTPLLDDQEATVTTGGGTESELVHPAFVVNSNGNDGAHRDDQPLADIYDDTKDKRRRQGFITCAILVVVIVIILSATLPNSDKDDDEAPSSSPTSSPSMQPSYSNDGLLSLLVEHSADGGEALSLEGTHQYQASQWLLDHPKSPGLLDNYTNVRILQRYAMATIYFAMNGELWNRNDNWLDMEVDECDWYLELETSCNPETKLLVDFVLRENRVGGTIPPEIHLLSNVQVVDLSFGDIRGTIPTTLGLLSDNLHSLILSSNRIAGTIPEEALSTMSNLQVLLLDSNMLECKQDENAVHFIEAAKPDPCSVDPYQPGCPEVPTDRPPPPPPPGFEVPPEEEDGPAGGVLPFSASARINVPPMPSLSPTYVTNNSEAPSSTNSGFPRPPPPVDDGDDDGEDGDNSNNNSTGIPIPEGPPPPETESPFDSYSPIFSSAFSSLSNLQVLNLANNPLGRELGYFCELSSEIGYLPTSLRELNLDKTFIHGSSLPTEIGKLSHLRQFRVPPANRNGGKFNLGRGGLPSELGKLSELLILLDRATLTSSSGNSNMTLPSEIGLMTSLLKLDFATVQSLTGTLPTEIGVFKQLHQLDFLTTGLKGTIPTEIGLLSDKLTLLRFKLSSGVNGTIPTEVGLLTNLRRFDIRLTQITGTLPSELGQLTKITYLDVGDTYLTGTIPTELNALSKEMQLISVIGTDLKGNLTELAGCDDSARTVFGSANVDNVECPCCQEKCFFPDPVIVVQNFTNGTIINMTIFPDKPVCVLANIVDEACGDDLPFSLDAFLC